MKSLGQHVLDTILEKKLITAKWHIDKGAWLVHHSHTADQIELAIRKYQKDEENWEVTVGGGESHCFTNEKQARKYAAGLKTFETVCIKEYL